MEDCLKVLRYTHSPKFSKIYLLVLSIVMRAVILDVPLSLLLLWLLATGLY